MAVYELNLSSANIDYTPTPEELAAFKKQFANMPTITVTVRVDSSMTWLDYLEAVRIPRTPKRHLWARNLQACKRR